MHPPFQKTLYRSEDKRWYYVRLLWQEASSSFEVYTAACGQAATPIRQEALLPGETKETALHRLAVALRQAGYWEYPTIDWHLDLEISTPFWEGFTAAAPWFDSLQFDTLYPLFAALEDTANGGNSGGIRSEPDRITYYMWTLDSVAAQEAVEVIARQVPAIFQLVARIRKRGEKPAPGKSPEPTQGESRDMDAALGLMIQLVEKLQCLKYLPENQPILGVTYQDYFSDVFTRFDPDRVRGEKANRLRQRLYAQWGIGKAYWPPLGNAAPCETLHVEGLADETAGQLMAVIQKRITAQVYAFDISGGIFVSEPTRIFSNFRTEDTYWFDEKLEWIVYISHHNTVTFGGDWLLKEVREIFREEPERLNPWWGGPMNEV